MFGGEIMSEAIEFYAQLWKQVRDDENEITMTIKVPANEFIKVIAIPTRKCLKMTAEVEE